MQGLFTLDTVKGPIKQRESLHESVLKRKSLVASMILSPTWYLEALEQWWSASLLYDLKASSRNYLACCHVRLQLQTKCLAEGTSTSSLFMPYSKSGDWLKNNLDTVSHTSLSDDVDSRNIECCFCVD